jgi:TfoX/Sxy family transcriptional regulator of competence genes
MALAFHIRPEASGGPEMAYDEKLAERIRGVVGQGPEISERKMFGGLAVMHQGNMVCGVVRDELMVRVGPDQYEEAVGLPHARPMDFTGRPMRGMVYVAAAGLKGGELDAWVERGLRYASSLPPKG